MNQTLKIPLILIGITLAVLTGFCLWFQYTFANIFPEPMYTKQDLMDNYEKRSAEIQNLKSYIDAKLPGDVYVDIEFEDGELGIFHVQKNGFSDRNWHLGIDSKKTDSLLKVIGWTKNDLKILQVKLEKANCISIANGHPTKIGWQRSGMGLYTYALFNRPLSDSLINLYNGGCSTIYYKENVVLEYGGGAIGPQCFPDK